MLFSMYGLTECKRVSYLPPGELDRRPGSVGIAIPGTRVDVVDDNGNSLPRGQVGELVVRGPHVMRGYWERPEETARRFRQDRKTGERVLYTGDLFRLDLDGFLYFVGRRDDMLIVRCSLRIRCAQAGCHGYGERNPLLLRGPPRGLHAAQAHSGSRVTAKRRKREGR